MTLAVSILGGVALAIVVLGVSQIAGPRCGKYRITDDSIEFVMFGHLRVWRSRFEDISDVEVLSFAELLVTPGLYLMNRPFGRYILVRRRRGVFRSVVITPDRTEEFLGIVREKIGNARSAG